MRTMIAKVFAIAVLMVAPSASAEPFRDAFVSVTAENFDDGGPVSRQFHLNAEAYFPMVTIPHLGKARELGFEPDIHDLLVKIDGELVRFGDYVAEDALLDGVVVVRGDKIVFEAYTQMQPWQRHFTWSVTKVMTSTALASLVEREFIDPAQPVETYVADLEGTAWAGVTVAQIADMASGIDCLDSDGYQDITTCVYTMEETLGITASTGRTVDFLSHLQSMKRRGPAGRRADYVSANTNLLMLIMEAATGKPFASLVSELIWEPIGAEADGLVAVSEEGYVYASGGLHARLRDVARFGLVFTDPDRLGVLSQSTISQIQQGGYELDQDELAQLRALFGDDLPVRTSWQWDFVWDDGAMYKGGYLGQGVYVDPAKDLVIAWFGTGLDYSAENNAMLPLSRQIAAALEDLDREPTR